MRSIEHEHFAGAPEYDEHTSFNPENGRETIGEDARIAGRIVGELDRLDQNFEQAVQGLYEDITDQEALAWEQLDPQMRHAVEQRQGERMLRIKLSLDGLRAARASDNSIIALRAEYLTARVYGIMDHDVYMGVGLDEDGNEQEYNPLGARVYLDEYRQYMHQYGGQFFDVGDDPVERRFEPGKEDSLTDEVAVPAQVYARTDGGGVFVNRVARDGVVFLTGYDKRAIGFGRVDENQQIPEARSRPSLNSLYEARQVLDSDHPYTVKSLLITGPTTFGGTGFDWSAPRLTVPERAAFWSEVSPSIGEATWELILSDIERTEGRVQSWEDRLVEGETAVSQYLGHYGVSSEKSALFQHDLESYITNLISVTDRQRKQVEQVEWFEDSNATDHIWKQLVLEPGMKRALGDQLGVDLSDMTLNAQRELIGFLGSGTHETFKRVTDVIADMEGARLGFLESFLALEHGEEFGDELLDIAEHIGLPQQERLTSVMERFRQNARDFAHLFKVEDQLNPTGESFTGQVELAMQERLTELLAVAEEVAVTGSMQMEVLNGSVQVGSFDELLSDMETFSAAVKDMTSTVRDGQVYEVDQTGQGFKMFRFLPADAVGKSVLLYVRDEGARKLDPQIEYGGAKGVEASVSFIIDPVSDKPVDVFKDGRVNSLSLRFDREGRRPDESASSEERDPTREDGLMSIDLGAVLGREDDFGVRIGRIIAAGNILLARRRGKEPELHHSQRWFDQERYGSAQGFKAFAGRVAAMAGAREDRAAKARAKIRELPAA